MGQQKPGMRSATTRNWKRMAPALIGRNAAYPFSIRKELQILTFAKHGNTTTTSCAMKENVRGCVAQDYTEEYKKGASDVGDGIPTVDELSTAEKKKLGFGKVIPFSRPSYDRLPGAALARRRVMPQFSRESTLKSRKFRPGTFLSAEGQKRRGLGVIRLYFTSARLWSRFTNRLGYPATNQRMETRHETVRCPIVLEGKTNGGPAAVVTVAQRSWPGLRNLFGSRAGVFHERGVHVGEEEQWEESKRPDDARFRRSTKPNLPPAMRSDWTVNGKKYFPARCFAWRGTFRRCI